MLTLPIKTKWFDMILSGEKKEEYREIKPYWIKRIMKWLGFQDDSETIILSMIKYKYFIKPREVKFKNGYSSKAPYFNANCTLSIGTGKEEWGAEKGKEYFILTVQEILKGSED